MPDCPYCGCDPCELETEREALRRLRYVRPVSADADERRRETVRRAELGLERLEQLHRPEEARCARKTNYTRRERHD